MGFFIDKVLKIPVWTGIMLPTIQCSSFYVNPVRSLTNMYYTNNHIEQYLYIYLFESWEKNFLKKIFRRGLLTGSTAIELFSFFVYHFAIMPRN